MDFDWFFFLLRFLFILEALTRYDLTKERIEVRIADFDEFWHECSFQKKKKKNQRGNILETEDTVFLCKLTKLVFL